jgi:hypothetical protein
MAALAILVVLAMPVLALVTLLRLVNARQARREQVVARQIALTDAIYGVLGPVVAPVVRRGRRGWIGVLAVPTGYADVALMVEIAQAELGPTAEIVLVPQDPKRPRERQRPATAMAA